MAISTMKGLAAVLVAGLMFAGSSANATTPTPWVHPGTHPYEGTPEAAAALHERAIGLPVADFMRGVAMFRAGQCEQHFLQDGEILQNTFTRGGVSRSVLTVVAFQDDRGRPLAATHEKRRSMRCRIEGRSDGATVVFPFVCGNWSVQFLPPVPVAIVPPAPPPPAPRQPRERVTTYVTPEPVQVRGGQTIVVGEKDCILIVGTPIYTTGGGVSTTNRFEYEGN